MKRQYKAALGIAGIAVVTTLLGVGIFLYFGSQIGVYVVGAGVPLTVVAAIGLYVRGTVARRNTTEGEFTKGMAESVGTAFRDELTTFNRLRRAYPRWNPDEARTTAANLADDFESAGVRVDVDDASFTVQTPGRTQKLEALGDRVDDFADDVAASFAAFARGEIDRSRDAADRVQRDFLDEGGDPVSVNESDVESDAPISEIESTLERARDDTAEVFERAIDRIEDALSEYGGDREQVASHFGAVRNHVEDGDWDGAEEELSQARDLVERSAADDFTADREALDQLLDTVERVDVDTYASDERLETFDRIRDQLDEMDSALSSDELDEAAGEARRAAIEVVATLESELERNVETIRDADVPMGFYTAPPAVATDYTARLEEADDLDSFRSTWLSATGELLDALETAEAKASVADSYDLVNDRIAESIRSSGEATADDLPVKDPKPFLELYAEEDPSVEFDPSRPAVVAEAGGETYTVDVDAQLSTSTGEQHELTLSLSGGDVDEQATDTTYVATETTFEEVPYGEYTLTASTPTEAFSDAETTIRVTDDVEESLVLSEVSLRERVCDGDEDEVRDQLPAVAPELEDRFEADEFLTPESDLPIADEYVPCLLVLWAEQEGYTARMDDDRLLVYDHDQFESRLQTIATHNVGDDDSITFDDMRTKFLSVPASDELISTTLRDLDVDVTVDENGVSA